MPYDCTKPLGDDLGPYMGADLKKICDELSLHGIVYESQFKKLSSMVCKHNANELVKLFSKKTRRCIWYTYDNFSCNFVFYDMDKYSQEEAIRLSKDYQEKYE